MHDYKYIWKYKEKKLLNKNGQTPTKSDSTVFCDFPLYFTEMLHACFAPNLKKDILSNNDLF